jgi:hypothetical protein
MPTTINSAGITFNDTTSLTSANIGTAQLVNGSVIAAKLGTTEQKQIAKAWVNFNGTTSPGTIRSSYNVSSVTKNGTGDYTVNFSTAMADANYSAALSTTPFSSPSNNHDFSFGIYGSYSSGATGRTVSSLRVQTGTITAAAALDGSELCVQIFGN